MPIFGIVLICYGQFDVRLKHRKHACITASIDVVELREWDGQWKYLITIVLFAIVCSFALNGMHFEFGAFLVKCVISAWFFSLQPIISNYDVRRLKWNGMISNENDWKIPQHPKFGHESIRLGAQ